MKECEPVPWNRFIGHFMSQKPAFLHGLRTFCIETYELAVILGSGEAHACSKLLVYARHLVNQLGEVPALLPKYRKF